MRLTTAIAPFLAALLGLILSLQPAAAEQSYRIRPGDTLRLEVLEDPGLNRDVLVAPDGRISVPLAGPLAAAGQTVEGLQDQIAGAIASNFAASPTVLISVAQVASRQAAGGGAGAGTPSITVYVMGEANTPGQLQLERGTTVLQAFASMGGFTPFAATKRIQLRRNVDGNEKIYAIDYTSIEAGKSQAGRTTLVDGDVIVIPQRKLFE